MKTRIYFFMKDNKKNKLISLSYTLILINFFYHCTNNPKSNYSSIDLLVKSDSLLNARPNDANLRRKIINKRLDAAKSSTSIFHYNEIIKIDPKNSFALYHIYMYQGKINHKKDYKNGQWEAIQSFYKAAATIDTLGEPFYWIGRSYEKKDEMDFDSALDAYNKSLELYLPDSTKLKVDFALKKLIKRKEVYKDFWK